VNLPSAIHEIIIQHFGTALQDIQLVDGGSHAQLARGTIDRQQMLVKWTSRHNIAPGLLDPCSAEARGLHLLAQTQALRVPIVYSLSVDNACNLACIVMEWIETGTDRERHAAGATFGAQLTALHRHTAAAYGLDHHNYCGATPQWNDWNNSWVAFYRDNRLKAQLEHAEAQGRMPPSRRDRLERLMARLDQWLTNDEPPSLLHGDLWSGNWLVDSSGAPVLIDPAVHYGHREMELAMSHLFSGFPAAFFDAYDEAWPPLPGRDDRIPLYQLYHLLNHLNLYGESYSPAIDRILQRYTA
jgi:fructosamine-3-kinase